MGAQRRVFTEEEKDRLRKNMKDHTGYYNNSCDRMGDKCVVISLRTLKYGALAVGISAALIARAFLSIGRA